VHFGVRGTATYLIIGSIIRYIWLKASVIRVLNLPTSLNFYDYLDQALTFGTLPGNSFYILIFSA